MHLYEVVQPMHGKWDLNWLDHVHFISVSYDHDLINTSYIFMTILLDMFFIPRNS